MLKVVTIVASENENIVTNSASSSDTPCDLKARSAQFPLILAKVVARYVSLKLSILLKASHHETTLSLIVRHAWKSS